MSEHNSLIDTSEDVSIQMCKDSGQSKNNFKKIFVIVVSVLGIIVMGSAQSILIPLMTLYFPSEYFILLLSTIYQFVIITIIMVAYFFIVDKSVFKIPYSILNNTIVIFFAGFFCAAMCAAKVYSSNPNYTSPIMQSTLAATAIIFTVLFSRLLLRKTVQYVLPWIFYSLLALAASLALPLIYEFIVSGFDKNQLWIICYIFGVACRGLYTVIQEKYFLQTNDSSAANKLKLLFYVTLVQLLLVVPCFGIEFLYDDDPLGTLKASFKIVYSDVKISLLFHGFILAYFLFMGSCTVLNSISSNYIMIASVIITPAVTIFFTIFNTLAPGNVYPLYITIPSLVLSLISTLAWITGEK